MLRAPLKAEFWNLYKDSSLEFQNIIMYVSESTPPIFNFSDFLEGGVRQRKFSKFLEGGMTKSHFLTFFAFFYSFFAKKKNFPPKAENFRGGMAPSLGSACGANFRGGITQ